MIIYNNFNNYLKNDQSNSYILLFYISLFYIYFSNFFSLIKEYISINFYNLLFK
jgi:hypothetical protein